MRLPKPFQLSKKLKRLESASPEVRAEAESYFQAAEPKVIERLQSCFEQKDILVKKQLYPYNRQPVGVFLALFLYFIVPGVSLALIFFDTTGLNEIFEVIGFWIFWLWFMFILSMDNSLWLQLHNACEALAISGHLTPNALIYLLEKSEPRQLKRLTPRLIDWLSSAKPNDANEEKVYADNVAALEKHLSRQSVSENLPLAIALIGFYARHAPREGYPLLSLSVSYFPKTETEKLYFEAAMPLINKFEDFHFPNSLGTDQFFDGLPASYSDSLSNEKRFAIHALAYLLPRFDAKRASIIGERAQDKMLRFLKSDPGKYPCLHLAIIGFVHRHRKLDALAALRQAAAHPSKKDDFSDAREQVRQAAESALRELEKLADQKQAQSALLRAGVPEQDLLRASVPASHSETVELLLRKGIEE